MKNSGSYLDEQLVAATAAAYKFYVRFQSLVVMRPKKPRFLATRWRMKQRGEEERKEKEKERVRSGENGRDLEVSGKERVSREERRLGPGDTRHRHIKSTLSKYTIIFVTPAWNAKCEISWRAAIVMLFLVNSDSSFYRVPPSSSVRLDNVRCGDKVSHFRWESRHFLSPWYVTIPPRNTQNCTKARSVSLV